MRPGPAGPGPTGGPRAVFPLLAAALLLAAANPLAGAGPPLLPQTPQTSGVPGGLRCESCHGELEFLRQRVPTLTRARSLLVPSAEVATSAHDALACAECHEGLDRFPHPVSGEDASRTCASCHEPAETAWTGSVHAPDDGAACSDCHGVHDVLPASTLTEPPGRAAMNGACVACHDASAIPAADPHLGSVSCAACHGSHEIRALLGSRRPPEPSRPETCGGCHEETLVTWQDDVHGRAVLASGGEAGAGAQRDGGERPPSCVTCHGIHPTRSIEGQEGQRALVEVCSSCHEEYAESFADSYHGQASRLGLERAATCAACHTSHEILPASDPASSVSEANLLATCRSCHPDAGEGFTGFQPHADHDDPEEYPQVFWSYWLMTGLLVSVFLVFGAHTVLWLIRLGLERNRPPTPPTTEARKEESA